MSKQKKKPLPELKSVADYPRFYAGNGNKTYTMVIYKNRYLQVKVSRTLCSITMGDNVHTIKEVEDVEAGHKRIDKKTFEAVAANVDRRLADTYAMRNERF
jgi:hypothetical protein